MIDPDDVGYKEDEEVFVSVSLFQLLKNNSNVQK